MTAGRTAIADEVKLRGMVAVAAILSAPALATRAQSVRFGAASPERCHTDSQPRDWCALMPIMVLRLAGAQTELTIDGS
jgi:hypothetical protein